MIYTFLERFPEFMFTVGAVVLVFKDEYQKAELCLIFVIALMVSAIRNKIEGNK